MLVQLYLFCNKRSKMKETQYGTNIEYLSWLNLEKQRILQSNPKRDVRIEYDPNNADFVGMIVDDISQPETPVYAKYA